MVPWSTSKEWGKPDTDAVILFNAVIKIVVQSWEGDIPDAFSLGVLVIIPKDNKAEQGELAYWRQYTN